MDSQNFWAWLEHNWGAITLTIASIAGSFAAVVGAFYVRVVVPISNYTAQKVDSLTAGHLDLLLHLKRAMADNSENIKSLAEATKKNTDTQTAIVSRLEEHGAAIERVGEKVNQLIGWKRGE
jgi:hypothetical protein